MAKAKVRTTTKRNILKEVAAEIARELFVDGMGRRAELLALVSPGRDTGSDGGWCEEAVVSEILAVLKKRLEVVD